MPEWKARIKLLKGNQAHTKPSPYGSLPTEMFPTVLPHPARTLAVKALEELPTAGLPLQRQNSPASILGGCKRPHSEVLSGTRLSTKGLYPESISPQCQVFPSGDCCILFPRPDTAKQIEAILNCVAHVPNRRITPSKPTTDLTENLPRRPIQNRIPFTKNGTDRERCAHCFFTLGPLNVIVAKLAHMGKLKWAEYPDAHTRVYM